MGFYKIRDEKKNSSSFLRTISHGLRPVLVGDENANKINQKTRFRFFGGSHCLSYENVKLIFRFKFFVPPIAYHLQNS